MCEYPRPSARIASSHFRKVPVNEQLMSEALNAIHDEAVRLLNLLSMNQKDLEDGLQIIISLARYKHDVRTTSEALRTSDSK